MLEQFLANPNLRPATKKHYRAVVSRFHQFVKEKPWEKVTATDLGQWLDQYENPVTKDVYLRTLKVFLR
ncbi:MAG: site-specific integrase, partial [Promethearchaeota archaeon]